MQNQEEHLKSQLELSKFKVAIMNQRKMLNIMAAHNSLLPK